MSTLEREQVDLLDWVGADDLISVSRVRQLEVVAAALALLDDNRTRMDPLEKAETQSRLGGAQLVLALTDHDGVRMARWLASADVNLKAGAVGFDRLGQALNAAHAQYLLGLVRLARQAALGEDVDAMMTSLLLDTVARRFTDLGEPALSSRASALARRAEALPRR